MNIEAQNMVLQIRCLLETRMADHLKILHKSDHGYRRISSIIQRFLVKTWSCSLGVVIPLLSVEIGMTHVR